MDVRPRSIVCAFASACVTFFPPTKHTLHFELDNSLLQVECRALTSRLSRLCRAVQSNHQRKTEQRDWGVIQFWLESLLVSRRRKR